MIKPAPSSDEPPTARGLECCPTLGPRGGWLSRFWSPVSACSPWPTPAGPTRSESSACSASSSQASPLPYRATCAKVPNVEAAAPCHSAVLWLVLELDRRDALVERSMAMRLFSCRSNGTDRQASAATAGRARPSGDGEHAEPRQARSTAHARRGDGRR